MSYVIKRKKLSIPQGTFKPNYTVVGSPTVNNGVVSGFSANDYVETPSKITLGDGDKLEIGFLTKAPSVSSTNTVSSIYNGNDKFSLSIVGSNVYYLSTYVTRSDGVGSSDSFSPYYIEPGEEVYCKVIIDNSVKKITCGFSRDGINYEYKNGSISPSSYVSVDSIMSIGKGSTGLGSSPCTTYIDLSKCYIKINDEYVWNCKYNEDVYDTISYVAKRKSRKYYKYVYESWEQPVMTANGTMGGNSFACDSSTPADLGFGFGPQYAYHAFDANAFMAMGIGAKWFSWYNPVDLSISKIEMDWAGSGVLQYSVDNSNWVTLKTLDTNTGNTVHVVLDLSSYSISAKYWKIYDSNTAYGTMIISNMRITGEARTGIIEGMPDDYDFYEDNIKSYVIGRK